MSWDEFSGSKDELADVFLDPEHSELKLNPMQCVMMTLIKSPDVDESDIPDDFFADWFEDDGDLSADLDEDNLTLFTPMRMNTQVGSVLLVQGAALSDFEDPILDRSYARDKIEYVERLTGKSAQQSMSVALELISDMERGTMYPPENKVSEENVDFEALISRIIEGVSLSTGEDR